MNLFYNLLISSTLFLLSGNMVEERESVSFKQVYSSKKCSYKVYTAKVNGVIRCGDWNYVDEVSPGNPVSIEIYPGEKTVVRIVYSSGNVCYQDGIKRQDNLSMSASASRSSVKKMELHDWNCK